MIVASILLIEEKIKSSDLEALVEQRNEAIDIAAKGLQVITVKDNISEEVEALKRQNKLLDEELKKIKSISRTTKITKIIRAETKPVEIHASKQAVETTDKPCILRDGDTVSIAVDQAELTTKAGNKIFTGIAQLNRLYNGTKEPILAAPLIVNVAQQKDGSSNNSNLLTSKSSAWSFGAVGMIDLNGKLSIGPMVSLTVSNSFPVRLSAGFTMGQSGTSGILSVSWR
jgi:hypothetical protein